MRFVVRGCAGLPADTETEGEDVKPVINDEVYVGVPPRTRVVFISEEVAEQLADGWSEPVQVHVDLRGDLYADMTMRKVEK
jgi:hypothetical protein